MIKKSLILCCVLAALLLITACGQTPAATSTPEPTATPVPTETPAAAPTTAELAVSTPGDVNVAYGLIKLPEGNVAATVNGVEITTTAYDEELRRQLVPLTMQYQLDWNLAEVQAYMPDIQDSILQQMIDFELLWQLGKAEGISITDEAIETEYASTKQSVLAGGQFTSWEQVLEMNNLTEEKAREQIANSLLVRAMVANHGGTAEELQAKASHILVESEETAKEVLAKLKAGESFEDLAKAYSTDTGTKDAGGDLGWFPQGMMVAEFDDAVFTKLQVGETSELVKTDYGYHIIRLVAREVHPLEGSILEQRQQENFTAWYQVEREAADIQEFLQLEATS